MKEFIDKLISRLEEEKGGIPKTEEDWNYCSALDDAIGIVNQVAEEYNNKSVKGDLISRSALLEEIKSLRVTVTGLRAGKGILAEYAKQYKDTLLRVIEEQPIACNDGWIPCSERLPEEPFGCLVTVMDCEPMTQTDFENILPYHVGYDGETWNDSDGDAIPFEVIAWQPLPPKFEPKGE